MRRESREGQEAFFPSRRPPQNKCNSVHRSFTIQDMEWYLKVLRQYADFNGRARRKEYWMFTLFNFLFAWGLILVGAILEYGIGVSSGGLLYVGYVVAVFIPSLAVSVRRLHDVGKSGWMLLIALIPIIGSIWLFILDVTDSEPYTNAYGPSPKYSAGPDKTDLIDDVLV